MIINLNSIYNSGATSGWMPLSLTTKLGSSWLYVRGFGFINVLPSHHNLVMANLFCQLYWREYGWDSAKEFERASVRDIGGISDLFMEVHKGVAVKSSVAFSPVHYVEGSLDNTELVKIVSLGHTLETLDEIRPEYLVSLKERFKKK